MHPILGVYTARCINSSWAFARATNQENISVTKPNKFVSLAFVLLIAILYGCIPTSVPIQSTITPESTLTLIPPATITETATTTLEPLTIEEMVKAFFAGEIDFSDNLSDKEYSDFIEEMNRQRGIKPIYVSAVDKNGNPTVMYYNTETRKMETLKGTYENNKEIIDQHGFNIYVEIGQNEQGLTTYIHPDTGEEIVVENSRNIDWDWVGNKNNAGENISQEALSSQILGLALDYGDSAIQVITINKEPAEMVFAQGKYFGYNCIEVIVIKNGIGTRAFVGANGGLILVDGNTGEEKMLGRLNGSSERKSIKANMVYYVFLPKNQEEWWEVSRQDIDQLENVVNPSDSYNELVDGYSVDGVVIVRASAIVLR
jgi:hypothetical protein